MLNYNKIHSEINFQRTAKTKLSKFMGIANSTLIDRLAKENLTPNDVEKMADYFKKPIAYFFDREENELNNDAVDYEVKRHSCQDCIAKQKEIDALQKALDAKDELLDMYRSSKKDQEKCG